MKNNLLTLLLLALFTQAFAQNNLRSVIQGTNGVSNPFVSLTTSQQVPFTASQAKALFGLDQNSDLVLVRSESDQMGYVHYRFYQTYQGIPIENTMYIAHTKSSLLTGMSGVILMDFSSQMPMLNVTAINAQQAIDAALQYVGAQKYMWQDPKMEQRIKTQTGNSNATYYPTATKVWYNAGEEVNPNTLQLAYKVDVYSQQPLNRAYYFVDAKTGTVIGSKQTLYNSDAVGTAATAYSGTQTIHSDLNGSTYRLRDYTKGDGVITTDQNGSDYSSTSANWSFANNNKYALDAHWGVSETYEYYFEVYGRNSVDDNGFALHSYVNESFTVDNAYWDGATMHFGVRSTDGSGVTAIDVTGHELTHGVTQFESNLNYSKESGAINESMSDIFGKSVQFWAKPTDINWQLSNDMNWIIRDMSNPNLENQPDTYHGHFWYNGSLDNGGVHTNSGVGNFMFYLLSTGGSGTNDKGDAYSVSGIGLPEAEAIMYRTNTVYLTPTSNYSAWRTAAINAATDLYGSTSNEVIQVENAFFAVGIGTAGGGCTDTAEPNDTKKTAAPIALNTDVTAQISSSTDIDFYSFANSASAPNIQVTLTNLPADYNIVLFDPNKAKVAVSKNSGTADEKIEYNTTAVGTYTVKVLGKSGAFSSSACYTLKAETSSNPFRLTEAEASSQREIMNVYPNPSNGNINLDYMSDESANATIKIYDMMGRVVYAQAAAIFSGDNHFNLQFNNLSNGFYFVELNANGAVSHVKIELQK